MEQLPVFLDCLRQIRLCERMLVISRRTPDEWHAFNSLSKGAKKRFDRLERRWLDAEDVDPYPRIPGTDPSTPQSSDSICTNALTFLKSCINDSTQQRET